MIAKNAGNSAVRPNQYSPFAGCRQSLEPAEEDFFLSLDRPRAIFLWAWTFLWANWAWVPYFGQNRTRFVVERNWQGGIKRGAPMQQFFWGILIVLMPSVLFLGWLIWRTNGPRHPRPTIVGARDFLDRD
jgi:hypothetical protein